MVEISPSLSVLTRRTAGRPPATNHGAIEKKAFALFERNGFSNTTTEQIASAVGISRRTLFRYFPSKFDIPWGQFEMGLTALRSELLATPQSLPLWEAITVSVISFNTFAPEAQPFHRRRMRLILTTPELQAHAALKHSQWRSIICEFTARRLNLTTNSLIAITTGHMALAMAVSAYEAWLQTDTEPLEHLIRDASRHIEEL